MLDLARLSRDVEVEIEASPEQIVIRSARGVRQDWDDQFQRMAAQSDDVLLDGFLPALSVWDDEEWE